MTPQKKKKTDVDEKTLNQMNIVLKERRNGKSREQCAKIAGIKKQRIQHWYNEGKNGFGTSNQRFYEHLKAIEYNLSNENRYKNEIKEYNRHTNKNKRNSFIINITKGQTRKEASKNAQLDLKLATKWDSLGKKGIKPLKNSI